MCNNVDSRFVIDVTEDDDLLEIMKELKESGRKIAKSVKRSQSNSSRTYVIPSNLLGIFVSIFICIGYIHSSDEGFKLKHFISFFIL